MSSLVFNNKLLRADWKELALINNWAVHSAGYNTFQYQKKGDTVYLRGLITRPTGSSNTFAVLPADARPKKLGYSPVVSNDVPKVVLIEPSGNINANGYSTGDWLCLDGIVFSTN